MMALKYREGTSTTDHGIITLDLAKSGVLNEEVRRRSQGSTSQSEKGHTKNYFFKLKRENKGGGDKHNRNDEGKSEHAVVTLEDLLVICDENLVNLACDETSWMGNAILVSVTGMRDVSLVSNNGTRLTLKDFRHASNIRLNLISVGKLDDEGKQIRASFRSRPPHRKSKLLELVHSDVCGPITDERSKLDSKTRQCIFIGYGLDGEFGYRLYDPVQKKLVRRQDVVFIEDQTIDDIDNTKKEDSPDSGDLTDVNLIPLGPSLNPIKDDVHGDVNDDQHDKGDIDAPIDDVVNDQQQAL
ncbi:hypothetical protein V6N12_066970 [Hibiscus sabdariffa]|uniref:Uncharacterized protein n=1 Tax=Hibiscus sabdariffa TaxID=183260 RepID=A0ABR2AWM9_9ROSI